MSARPLLEVRDLTVSLPFASGGRANVIENVNFSIEPRGTVGLVGESGSGKTMTSLAIVGLLPTAARVEAGEILLDGEDLLQLSQRDMQKRRGADLGMVLQDPMTALDPLFTVRNQLTESVQRHQGLKGSALDRALETALEQVQLSAAQERLRQYPHQLSGGMRQRVTSAIVLAGRPKLLIADEPTTALDVTTQARYLQMLEEVQEEFGFGLLLVAHDLLLVRDICKDVVVMYAGQVVENGPIDSVFDHPEHPYTRALLRAIPAVGESGWLESIEGKLPGLGMAPPGCRFSPRCRYAREACSAEPPPITDRGTGRQARCWGTAPEGWVEW